MPTSFVQYDVFTDRPLAGNQLAVFLDGSGFDPGLMQRLAQEMAFPETTFVLSAEDEATDVRVRIFTPATELPMAGHPTIGTAFALAGAGRITTGQARVTFGLGVGPTPVRLEWRGDRLAFAWMSQAVPTFGHPVLAVDAVAGALGVGGNDIRATGLPIQEASSGVPFLYVPLTSRDAVDAALLDRAALRRFFAALGSPERPVFVFTLDGSDDRTTVYSRMFAPVLGVHEDPATGSASGPLGAYLVTHGVVTADEGRALVSVQGVKMGRPSRVHIAVGSRDGIIEQIEVGGQAVKVADCTLTL